MYRQFEGEKTVKRKKRNILRSRFFSTSHHSSKTICSRETYSISLEKSFHDVLKRSCKFLYYKYFLNYRPKCKENHVKNYKFMSISDQKRIKSGCVLGPMGLFQLKSRKVCQLKTLAIYKGKKMSVFLAHLVDIYFFYLSVKQKKKKKTPEFCYVLVYKSKSISRK